MAYRIGNLWLINDSKNYYWDWAYGSEASEVFVDTDVSATIYGNGGNDTFILRGGYDTVYGGSGNDTFFVHGRNATTLWGNSGADKFYIEPDFSGSLTIKDFGAWQGDQLVFEKGFYGAAQENHGATTGMSFKFYDGSSVFVENMNYNSMYDAYRTGAILIDI